MDSHCSDFGYDPLGLGSDPVLLAKFRENEVRARRRCAQAHAALRLLRRNADANACLARSPAS
jgi:hypothetical protein